jgi:TrmH family RNA methyltransferase
LLEAADAIFPDEGDYRRISLKDSLFAAISDTVHSQGVMMAVPMAAVLNRPMRRYPTGLYLLLDRLKDPGNMGTVIRTADAAAVDGIAVIRGSVDLFNPKVVRGAMGSLFRVPVASFATAGEAVDEMHRIGVRVITATAGSGATYTAVDMAGGTAIGIGNEADGAGGTLLEKSDVHVRIPMPGGTESLNAAVAAGILLYEALRQRRQDV